MTLIRKKSQSTAEYAVLLSLVIAVAVGMQTYIKRGMNAKMKNASDGFVEDLRTAYNTELTGSGQILEGFSTAGADYEQYEFDQTSSTNTNQFVGSGEVSTVDFTNGNRASTLSRETSNAAGDYQTTTYDGSGSGSGGTTPPSGGGTTPPSGGGGYY